MITLSHFGADQSIGKSVWFDNVFVDHYSSEVLEENHYYPYGLTLQTSAMVSGVKEQPLKLTTKELEKSFDLNMYDFGARTYDMTGPRWVQIDPLAEKYYSISPYVYCANNPVKYIDPDGRDVVVSYTRSEKNGKVYIKADATINLTIVDPGRKLSGTELSYITQNGSIYGGTGLSTSGTYDKKKMETMTDVSTSINLRVVSDVSQANPSDFIIQSVSNIPGIPIGLATSDAAVVENQLSGKAFAGVVLHELGHIMGIDHAPGTIMNETMDTKPSANIPQLNENQKIGLWNQLTRETNSKAAKGTYRTKSTPEDSRKELNAFIKKNSITP